MQKQRIALARAVYADPSVYVFDDVLSAVDAHVCASLFENLILKKLKGRTRVLVMHQLQYLKHADSVIVMEDGKIAHVGTFDELKAAGVEFPTNDSDAPDEPADGEGDDIALAGRSESHVAAAPARTESSDARKESDKGDYANRSKSSTKAKAEKRVVGVVKLKVWFGWVRSVGTPMATVIILSYCMQNGLTIFSTVWLAKWTNIIDAGAGGHSNSNGTAHQLDDDMLRVEHLLTSSPRKLSSDEYLGVYSALMLLSAIFVFVRTVLFAVGSVRASTKMHEDALMATLRSPMSFFDTTLTGRIINRFSADMQKVDLRVRMVMGYLLAVLFLLFTSLGMVVFTAPYVALLLVPMTWLYLRIASFYRASSRELQRVESISKSPIYSQFTEALNGLSTIRAFRLAADFMQENERRVQRNLRVTYILRVVSFWLQLRLCAIGSAIVTAAAFYSIFISQTRKGVSAGFVGLSLSYAMKVTDMLNGVLMAFVDAETTMVAVERVLEYRDLPPEPPLAMEGADAAARRASWPSSGKLEYRNVSLRYRDTKKSDGSFELPRVLKNVSFTIEPGACVGIVGRTAAGKSSLLVLLLRLVELTEGQILIDDVDIATLGLNLLRRSIAIIPQDPVLFSGSLRFNLDPFDEHQDAKLLQMLQKVDMLSFVKSKEEGLQMLLSGGGENLSVGQRQLICLARALLSETKVLVLDEATASVDYKTDHLIQTTLQREARARGVTMLVIAHRIDTILSADKVIVMERGEVAEFDTVDELRNDTASKFYGFLDASNSC